MIPHDVEFKAGELNLFGKQVPVDFVIIKTAMPIKQISREDIKALEDHYGCKLLDKGIKGLFTVLSFGKVAGKK